MRTGLPLAGPRPDRGRAIVAALALAVAFGAGPAAAEIRVHKIASPPQQTPIRTHGWEPGAPSQIKVHNGRTIDPSRIPKARSGAGRTTQDWRDAPSRMRPAPEPPGAAR
jgi:hypothetical protein